MPHSQRPIYALTLRLAGAALFSVMFMLVKLSGELGVALPETMFWRQALSLPMLAGWLALTGGLPRLKTRRLRSHATRAVTGMTGMVCGFGAASLLPLAEATSLGFTMPLFAVLITALVMREHVGPWRWTAVLLGFAGVVIIAQPHGQAISLLGTVAGLAGGLFVAIVSFQIRDLARTEEPVSIVFYFALFGTLLMALPLPFFATSHTTSQWLVLLGIGIFGTLGQLLFSAALRHGVVASVIVMDYTSLVWATLLGWLVWDNLPPAATWLGAPAIMAAGMIVTWREHRLARDRAPISARELE